MRHQAAPVSATLEDTGFCAFEKRAEAIIRRQISEGFLQLAIESPAYWHPNGFAVFPLQQVGTDLLRLHVWPAIQKSQYDWHPEIHSHDRHVASVSLGGYKNDHRWKQAEGDEYEVYIVEDVGSSTTFVTTGQLIGLRETDVRTYNPDEFYVEAAGNLHGISKPEGVPCATLCLKSEIVEPSAQRVVGTRLLDKRVTRRSLLSQTEKSGLLTEVPLHK
jgi:hypothetical protein